MFDGGKQKVIVERSFDANRLKEIINHPGVRSDVAELSKEMPDPEEAVLNKSNFLLMGDYGCCMFFCIMNCMYEVHTQILPEGRGSWAADFVKACADYMFTKTDALEVITRVPHGHLAAKALSIHIGFKLEFTRQENCVFRESVVPVDIYSQRIQDWFPRASNMQAIGHRFHEHLHAEAIRLGIQEVPHGEDPNHNQYVGACVEMAMAGLPHKAMTFYNRWTIASRHFQNGKLGLIYVASEDPIVMQFDLGFMKINGSKIEDIEVMLCG